MLSAAATTPAANAPANPTIAPFSGQAVGSPTAFHAANAPSFSQAYWAAKGTQSQTAVKPTAQPRTERNGSKSNSQNTGATPPAPKDSNSQKGTTPAAAPAALAAPGPAVAAPTPGVPQAIAMLLSDEEPIRQSIDSSEVTQPTVSYQPETKIAPPVETAQPAETPIASPRETAAEQRDHRSDVPLVSDAPPSSEVEANPPQLEQTTSAPAPATHSPQLATLSQLPAHSSAGPQPPAPNNPAAQAEPANISARDSQNLANSANQASAAAQTQLPLSSAATLIAATGESAPSAKSADENREIIAQRVQPGLPVLSSPAQPGAIQSIQSLDSTGNGTAQNSGGSAQSGGHSPAQAAAQSPAQTHSGEDTKPGATDPSQSTSKDPNATVAATQGPPAIALSTAVANASAGTSQSAHLAAAEAAAAQSGAFASASTKSPQANSPAADSPQSSAPMLPSLPRSLSDVSQATQLYQRVAGAEMHIAMDTDLLGSIDLRAMVHQGSLSATIGVQRADVQTLLVNELPALQHSLAERNLQVAQISVLAGSVGSGTNANSQPRDQQNQPGPHASAAPDYRDDPPSFVSGAHMSEIAPVATNSARLSVLA